MKIAATSTCLQSKHMLQILDNIKLELVISDNPHSIPMDKLFLTAARVNKNRGFLFVSTVLGKHIPVHPLKPLILSGLLAMEYFEKTKARIPDKKKTIAEKFLQSDHAILEEGYSLLKNKKLPFPEQPIVIGFAETATALAHGVFDCMEGASFIHTTRERMEKEPVLAFEEEHSHAVSHQCFASGSFFSNDRPVLLVDDEITTGKTAINIIRDIQKKFPRKEYAILSILDWRSDEHKAAFRRLEEELDINVTTVALLSGNIKAIGAPLEKSSYNFHPNERRNEIKVIKHDAGDQFAFFTSSYIKETGRFGLADEETSKIEQACLTTAKHLRAYRTGARTLCIGTGEFMYIPMRIAAGMGGGILYQSSTRSPIHPNDSKGYAITNGYTFKNPEDQEIQHFLYNIPYDAYDEIFYFLEKDAADAALEPLLNICSDRGIKALHVVTFFGRGDADV
ncbi:phosphoribosyltransferase family protein [Bacillus gobiensis]|uniref:phosphoribosyltransferase family protein n=1 Tax=Bacillus gobiensis TaxID=1441095 RepID=UPI003D2215AF